MKRQLSFVAINKNLENAAICNCLLATYNHIIKLKASGGNETSYTLFLQRYSSSSQVTVVMNTLWWQKPGSTPGNVREGNFYRTLLLKFRDLRQKTNKQTRLKEM